nr:baseplate J/gp47 family protein [uncultured Agathobaculum sp.]
MSTANEILTNLLAAMPDSYQKTVGYPTHDLLAAVSLRMEGTDEEVAAMRAALDPENLTGGDLDRYVFPRSGLERRQATFATGVLTVTGTGTVQQGALFESGGGIQFAASETVQITGEGQVRVTCRVDGAAGNLPAHSITQMPVTLQGIAACDNPEPTTGGYDEEDDAAYYARYLLKIRTPATSGNIYHYQSWALEVSGVGAVQVFPLARGPGTVDIVLIDSTGQPAPPDLVQQVQDYIDPGGTGEGYGQAPIGAQCLVEAATGTEIDLSASVFKLDTADEETVTAGIKAAVGAYLAEIAFQQDYVSFARITERILAVEGVRDLESLTLNGGTDNVHLDERACAVLGEVTLSYA